MKKKKTNKKVASALAMLMLSAAMLGTSTYAWFTMNKDVSVTGMKLKAQAEKGILINEMAGISSGTWSEEAFAKSTVNALRPASTADFTNWWHANSKKTNTEAGISGTSVDTNTVQLSSGTYYSDISNISAYDVAASADTNAANTVYYINGTGSGTGYDNGEGFYVKYVYYIKSSGNESLTVPADKLTANVTATLQGGAAAQDLDKAIRVGIKVKGDSKATIFAPVSGSTTTAYNVTGTTAGGSVASVTPNAGGSAVAVNAAAVTLPKVSDPGLEVDVYVWFEGEDVNCKSDNLAETLNDYQIDITFSDAALATDSVTP